MRSILILFLCLQVQSTYAKNIESLNIITPINYKKESSNAQTMKSKSLLALGNLVDYDVKAEVLKKLKPYESSLVTYFKDRNEYNNFVNTTLDKGIKTHLEKMNDPNMKDFAKFLGNNLLAGVAGRIMVKEGISNPARRNAWLVKILTPFNACINKSENAYYDGLHCVDALSSSLVPTIGSALVYEMTDDKISGALGEIKKEAFNHDQVRQYESCITKTKSTPSDVKNCALLSMKSGVQKVTEISLDNIIKTKINDPNQARNIKDRVLIDFKKCNSNVGSDSKSKVEIPDQFMNCIDTLVQKTGGLVVNASIAHNSSVLEGVGQNEATKLADSKAREFESCVAELKSKNLRGKDGLLDIARCEKEITSDVTFNVVSNTLRKSAKDQFTNKAEALKVGEEGVKILKACWKTNASKSSQDACLKNTIITFSKSIASIKLDQAIPLTISSRNALKNESMTSLGSCLTKSLPSDITAAKDLDKDIEKCTNPLTLNVAKKVATIQIKDSAKGNLTNTEIDSLIKQKVDGEFLKCLGKSPDSSKLEKCANSLTTESAKIISAKGFEKEVNDFIKENGGLSSLGMTQKESDTFLNSLSKTNNTCLDSKMKTALVIDHVNSCLKSSIKSIALFLGEAKFNKSVGEMYKDHPEEKKTLTNNFKKNLGNCLASQDAPKFSLDDYTKNISTCSSEIEKSTTKTVATDQVDASLNEYLKDRPGMDNSAKRNTIKEKLLSNFNTCNNSGENTNSCVDELKKNATIDIVSSYGRDETMAQLLTPTLPATILQVENTFKACSNRPLAGEALSIALDECIRDYALSFAKELGSLKFNHALLKALGTNAFNESRPSIDQIISEYTLCLDNLKSFKMSDDLTNKISVCTKKLEKNGMQFISGTLNNWMNSEDKNLANIQLKKDFSNFIPCLSVLLPASPYTPALEQNIESIMKPVAKLLAQYIEYNPENAATTLYGILDKLKIDLGDAAKTHQAKIDILNFIYKEGTLDQFLKSFIRGEVSEAFKDVSEKDIPAELKSAMLERENFEKMFNSSEGALMKEDIFQNILKPMLLENKDLSSQPMKEKVAGIQAQVVKILIDAPTFGKAAIKVNIQNQMNHMNGLKKFVAKAIYGKNALDWDQVRLTPHGQKAEAYITDKILTPKFKGETVSESEMKKINAEAEKLVTEAVKKFKKS